MFRIKKTPEGDGPEPAATVRPEPVEEKPAPEAQVPRRATPIAARPLGSPNFPLDLARGRGETAGGPTRGDASPAVGREKCLVVGKDVRLEGKVLACDKIVVEGEAELDVSGCRSLSIGASGVFRGVAEVGEADVAGRFEGELSTRERLAVRATGRLQGKFRYGQITIDAGGQISGELARSDARPEAPAETSPEPSGGGASAAGRAQPVPSVDLP